jgi:hypothetical protein
MHPCAPVAAHPSKNSHAFENMVEHVFLAELLRHMWYQRGEVVEVAKAQVDSWGYDVVLAAGNRIRYVQLKASLPADVNERLADREGGCIVAALPGEDATRMRYRLWEAKGDLTKLPPAKSSVYKRDTNQRHERTGHRHVRQGLFSKPPSDIVGLCEILFPPTRAPRAARGKR